MHLARRVSVAVWVLAQVVELPLMLPVVLIELWVEVRVVLVVVVWVVARIGVLAVHFVQARAAEAFLQLGEHSRGCVVDAATFPQQCRHPRLLLVLLLECSLSRREGSRG